MPFEPHPRADQRRRSAAALVKILLSIDSADVLQEHVRELIDVLLWKITEADGKANTRYRTTGALRCSDKRLLRHEHVYQKAKMIEALFKAEPDAVENILRDAVGCIVTADEHERLKPFDAEYGWDRYRKAGLEVHDMISQRRVI